MSRQLRQWEDLRLELSFALELPASELDRQARLTEANTIRSLRWSSAAVTEFEHAIAGSLEPAPAQPDVCGDMRAWVRSGYRTLSAGSKTFAHELDLGLHERSLFRVLRAAETLASSDPLLPYEGPAEKALAARLAAVELKLVPFTKRILAIDRSAQLALGVISQAEAEEREHPHKGSVEIGHGRAAAGASYMIWVEPKRSQPRPLEPHCQINLNVEEHESERGGAGIVLTSGGSTQCLSRTHPQAPSVMCGDGLLTIEAQTPPQARSARLRLSNGRQITSPVAIVPASLGGPVGFYYQVVRGPSPIPLSLAEIDPAGKVLRTVKLPRTERCVKHHYKPAPTYVRTVAHAVLPAVGSFVIVGEREEREYSEARFTAEAEDEGGFGFGAGGILSAGGALPDRFGVPRTSPFKRQMEKGCQPHEYAIVFGVLSAPRDTVLVRSAGSLMPLHRARIPGILRVHGVLAYIVLPAVPTEVIVRAPSGKTLSIERLAPEAREEKEFCEGEAEGPG
jgi:hypothetical protein